MALICRTRRKKKTSPRLVRPILKARSGEVFFRVFDGQSPSIEFGSARALATSGTRKNASQIRRQEMSLMDTSIVRAICVVLSIVFLSLIVIRRKRRTQ